MDAKTEPKTGVILEEGDTCRLWVVLCCPYCGEQHDHGAGLKFSAHGPEMFLGHRASHCTTCPCGGYELVDVSERVLTSGKRCEGLEKKVAAYARLSDAQDRLLVNYRIGTRRGVGKILDDLHKAKEDLATLGKEERDAKNDGAR